MQHFTKVCKVHGYLKSHEMSLKLRARSNWIEITCQLCRRESHKKDYENTSRLDERILKKNIYCHYCKTILNVEKFSPSGLKPKHPRCKICASRLAKKYFVKYALLKRYHLSVEKHQEMVEQQKNLCGICNQPETRKNGYSGDDARLCIDHNHESGQVRLLLCSSCNSGIGFFKESSFLLRKAADYLDGFNG